MSGLLLGKLTDNQIAWLQNNVDWWLNNKTVLYISMNGSKSTIWFVKKTDYSASRIIEYWTLGTQTTATIYPSRTGDGQGNATSENDTYQKAYYGNLTSASDFYLYGDNGYVNMDPYITLGMGIIPEDRAEFKLTKIKKSKWQWINLYNVISELKALQIKALPETLGAQMNLAFQWDSLMSDKFMSKYLWDWNCGFINEEMIAITLAETFRNKWNRLYDAMEAEYDALYNYDMTEEQTYNDSEATTTENEIEESNSGSNSGSQSSKIFGYNSSQASDDSSVSDSNSFEGSRTSGATGGGTRDAEGGYTLTRKGNIGTMTTQDLIEKEWNLRKKLLLKEIQKDISDTLTLSIYDFD